MEADRKKAEEEERRNLEIARKMQEEWGQEGGSKDEELLC